MGIKSFFDSLLKSGMEDVALPSEKRNVWLTNLIALSLSVYVLIVLIYRTATGDPFSIFKILFLYWALYITPIILNRFRFTNLSRILISWIPSVLILDSIIVLISNSFEVETSTFFGVRLFLIPFATIPFLVFSSSEKSKLALGLAVPVACVFLYDPILNFFDVGYYQVGLHDSSYSYNNVRIFLSYTILSLALYFLKEALEKKERVNELLLLEIEEKNKIILSKAEDQIAASERKYHSLSEQTSELNRKMGELRLMALRSVMNPHFIFNVLNSIQFFIAGNDRLNAINYLSKFSKLMRAILTNSVNNKIRLNEEIEILKNYIQLEMVRFEGKFNYTMEIDPDLEIDSIEIPSLLIQPYVENAILHGLYNKQEKGNLTIRIHEKDDSVVFEIEDDGVGREAAMKIKEQSFSDHKSLGVKLTEERLKLINEHHNVSFEIIDLKNTQGPCGTKVIIWVKI